MILILVGTEYLINLERSQEGHMNVNYNFLVKLYSELNNDQKLKFSKSLQVFKYWNFKSRLIFILLNYSFVL